MPINWGMVCSVSDQSTLAQLLEFGKWLVRNLEESGSSLRLYHKFSPEPSIFLSARVGDMESVKGAYQQINEQHPNVLYVVHILPEKNTQEHTWMKKLSVKYALIGQGILLDSALSCFSEYGALENIMHSMNQWISQRMYQLLSRHNRENNFKLMVHGSKDSSVSFFSEESKKLNFSTSANTDFGPSVEAVLHSMIDLDDLKRMAIAEGFPLHYNKFQIASLFHEFPPQHVLRASGNQAILDFENKFHVAQMLRAYGDSGKKVSVGSTEFTLRLRLMAVNQPIQAIRDNLKSKILGAMTTTNNEGKK